MKVLGAHRCWTSHGEMLKRSVRVIFSLFKQKGTVPCDDKWLSVVYCVAGMFQVVNTFNWSLRGKGDVLTKRLSGWVCWLALPLYLWSQMSRAPNAAWQPDIWFNSPISNIFYAFALSSDLVQPSHFHAQLMTCFPFPGEGWEEPSTMFLPVPTSAWHVSPSFLVLPQMNCLWGPHPLSSAQWYPHEVIPSPLCHHFSLKVSWSTQKY